ncbi:MAG: Mu-like prophage major head subunit gpT family protein [Patescibacteria group bacterium]
MLKALKDRLVAHGLPANASERDAQDFYAHLSLDEKGKIGVEMGQGLSSEHAQQEPLSVREEPLDRRDLITRNFQVRAATINEEERSVEAVISTDTPVEVWDWRRGELIDEVLLAPAARMPTQMPMLANHDRWSLDSVLGSIRNIRVEGGNVIGRLFFARDDADADKAWNKVRQGHIIDVSVGYRVNEAVEIAAGQTATVAGKTYTAAANRAMRIATAWTPKEGSLVPIGADQAAKIREAATISHHKEDSRMNPKLRAFLETLGLRKDASDAEAQAFYDKLNQADKARADAAAKATEPVPPEGQRSEPPAPPAPPAQPIVEGDRSTPSVDEAARNAVNAERDRVRQIRELAGQDVPQTLCARAIDEGWDLNRARGEFLTAVRTARQETPVPYQHTALTAPPGNANARALAAGLMLATGTADPTQRSMHNGRREPTPTDRLTAQDAEQGHRYMRMSAIDLVRECVRLDTGRMCWDPSEALELARSSPSGGTLAYVFTTSMYARLIAGWEEVPDTTDWCDVEDVPNFLTQEDISLAANARLQQLPRGDTAKDATVADARETYKIARYAKQFVVDEQDIIDDRLGAIMRMPQEMGAAARRLRPDLVYALLLANAALADTGALFNATAVTTAGGHANLTTAVLGATGIKAAILAMGKYREADGTTLNIKPRYLIVPSALQWTAKELLTSTAQAYTAAAAAATPSLYYPINVIAGENLSLRVDDRIGAAGVVDPTTNASRTGLDTNWLLSAGGPRTVRVAYRRGTNRQPVMRSFLLDKGQWGLGWDINLDIGAKALDYRGLHKSAGTG